MANSTAKRLYKGILLLVITTGMCIAGVNAGKHNVFYKNEKTVSTYNKLKAGSNATENNHHPAKLVEAFAPEKNCFKPKRRSSFIPVVDDIKEKSFGSQLSAPANKHLIVLN